MPGSETAADGAGGAYEFHPQAKRKGHECKPPRDWRCGILDPPRTVWRCPCGKRWVVRVAALIGQRVWCRKYLPTLRRQASEAAASSGGRHAGEDQP